VSTDRWVVKFAAGDPARFDAEAHIPVFHRWIQKHVLPLVLVDVSNYAHVPDGPGVLLVSHEYNLFADRFDGRPGLTVQRKLRGGAGALSLLETLAVGVKAILALEAEATLPGSRFDLAAVEVVANDRLRAPNDDEGWKAVEPALRAAAAALYGDDGRAVRVDVDASRRLTAKLTGTAVDARTMLGRLEAASREAAGASRGPEAASAAGACPWA
jgi:hypothetical protein